MKKAVLASALEGSIGLLFLSPLFGQRKISNEEIRCQPTTNRMKKSRSTPDPA